MQVGSEFELGVLYPQSIARYYAFDRNGQAMSGQQAHWENVYANKAEHDVSWFQETPSLSLDLIRATGLKTTASIIDVGGGASRLVDMLFDEGFETVTVLD